MMVAETTSVDVSTMNINDNDDPPYVAVRWIIRNVSSNVELATLSNVCRRWREIVSKTILEEIAVVVVVGENEEDNHSHNNNDDDDESDLHAKKKATSSNVTHSRSHLSSLLLPSTASLLARDAQDHHQEALMKVGTKEEIHETYCVAWFHPDGIEFKQLPLDENDDDDNNNHNDGNVFGGRSAVSGVYAGDHRVTSGEEAFAPSGELSYVGSDHGGAEGKGRNNGQHFRRNHHHQSRSPAPMSSSYPQVGNSAGWAPQRQNNSNVPVPASTSSQQQQRSQSRDSVSCMYQWNGYSEVMDILQPFGYASSFVRRLLDEVHLQHSSSTQQEKLRGGWEGDVHSKMDNFLATAYSSASSISGQDSNAPPHPCFPPSRSLAVRGATYARPEGYCLCWDQDLLLDRMFYSVEQDSNDSRAGVRQQEWEEIRRRRNRRRTELQREVLPVVLWSKRPRGPLLPQVMTSKTTTTTQSPQEEADAIGICQPCIQFLNIDSRHAVRLFTPLFEQGPISTPLTVFCVAVATEDGCFFSGLRRRFEFGHLYPGDGKDSLIERSPVCIVADYINRPSARKDGQNDFERMSSSTMERRTSGNGLYQNSDDSSCDMSYMESAAGEQGWKCNCPLTGLGDLVDQDEATSSQPGSNDHPEETSQVCRGKLGPGRWHCYVAIFDGEQSEIRIDGVVEPVTCNHHIPRSSSAYLDGLTIGSDHTFDMSLCFGQGSDGEGQGAMAELAIFKGHFDETDLMALEGHFMTKHGIPHPTRPQHEMATDYDYSRLAQGLLIEYDPVEADGRTLELESKPIPLRYLTNLRALAWKQLNPVTGEEISVQQIGTKSGNNSSSDW